MTQKRDNAYYRNRLIQMNRDDLVEMIDAGDISMYRACLASGIRKKNAKANLDGFNRSWKRLSRADRRQFVHINVNELVATLRSLRVEGLAKKQ